MSYKFDRAELDGIIDKFLSERIEAVWDGFAPVSNEHLNELSDIICRLVILKWAPDVDGDYPVTFRLADRNKERFLFPCTIAHRSPDNNDLKGIDDLLSGIETYAKEARSLYDQSKYAVEDK